MFAPTVLAPAPVLPDPAASTDALRTWMFERLLPFWAEIGVDRRDGGFVEQLTPDRRPELDRPRRSMVQARQIYVFSQASLLGAPGWTLDTARRGFQFLTSHHWDRKDGGWWHSIDRNGRPNDRRKDAYDHAFVLFAMAWLFRATGEREPLDWADRTIDWVNGHLGDLRHGGYHEHVHDGLIHAPLPRRQNPHMHLLEAFLALFEVTGEAVWLDRAREIVELFRRHFFDAATGSLGEYFTLDWRPAPGPEGQWCEPGHHFEWVWLLMQYRRLAGEDGVIAPSRQLYRFALDHGIDRTPQGIPAVFEAVDRHGAVLRDVKRVWPQTEAIKAFLARHEVLGDPAGLGLAREHLAGLFRHFLKPGHAVWTERLTRNGQPTAGPIPASSLYHVICCLAEALRVIRA